VHKHANKLHSKIFFLSFFDKSLPGIGADGKSSISVPAVIIDIKIAESIEDTNKNFLTRKYFTGKEIIMHRSRATDKTATAITGCHAWSAHPKKNIR
jgi:hypothetical protein